MLPFNMRDAIIASVLTSSSHTIVLSVYLSATPGAKEHLSWQVSVLPSQKQWPSTALLSSHGRRQVTSGYPCCLLSSSCCLSAP